MTTPEEQTRAVVRTRAFLQELSHMKFNKAGTVHRVRREAEHLLRHYPIAFEAEAEFAARCIAFASNPKRGRKPF